MTYALTRLPENARAAALNGTFDPARVPAPFGGVPEGKIDDYPWAAYPERFPAFFRLGWNASGVSALMYARETPVLANETRFGGATCRDSCMEFFFMPFPKTDRRYLNIEINPIGTPHVSIGEGRFDRRVWREAVPGMTICVSEPGEWWAVSFFLPMDFIKSEYGQALAPGASARANFYKCSEDIHCHYGTWNPVLSPKPDFHRPECFGAIEFI